MVKGLSIEKTFNIFMAMNVQKKTFFMIFMVLLSVGFLMADVTERDGVNFTGRSLNFIEDSSDLTLLPDFKGRAVLEKELKNFKPSGVVELLYTMPIPETGGKDMMLHILQSISAVSTLEGIKYYSGSRKAMYPYLEEAYAVDKRKSHDKVADPVFNVLPSGPQTITVYQNDTTFGKAWYDVSFEVSEDAIQLTMINTTTIRYKLFPVLRDENLEIKLLVIPRENDLLFYGMAAFKLGNTFGIELSLDQSFDHRMSALQTWFSNQTYR